MLVQAGLGLGPEHGVASLITLRKPVRSPAVELFRVAAQLGTCHVQILFQKKLSQYSSSQMSASKHMHVWALQQSLPIAIQL